MDGPSSKPVSAPVILLAAGRSSRAGEPKGLIDVHGQPWLACQLERMAECHVPRVVVVLGFGWDAYRAAFPWIDRAHAGALAVMGVEVQVARNLDPDRGPFSSLVCGIERLGRESAFVLPIDVPCPGRVVWHALSLALAEGSRDAAIPMYQGKGGHPVLGSAAFLERLRRTPIDAADARLDAKLRALPAPTLARIEVDDVRVGMNLNTPEDWRAMH